MLLARRGGPRIRGDARAYLRLRRAYERAGYAVRAHDAPLAFIAMLRSMNAPGVDDAENVVALYLRARFGATDISAEDRKLLQASLQNAQRALSRRRAGRSKRGVAA